jgi:hypothetical protein
MINKNKIYAFNWNYVKLLTKLSKQLLMFYWIYLPFLGHPLYYKVITDE